MSPSKESNSEVRKSTDPLVQESKSPCKVSEKLQKMDEINNSSQKKKSENHKSPTKIIDSKVASVQLAVQDENSDIINNKQLSQT